MYHVGPTAPIMGSANNHVRNALFPMDRLPLTQTRQLQTCYHCSKVSYIASLYTVGCVHWVVQFITHAMPDMQMFSSLIHWGGAQTDVCMLACVYDMVTECNVT